MSTLRYVGRSLEEDDVLDRNTMMSDLNIPITKDGLEAMVRSGVQSSFLGREDFEARKIDVVSNDFLSSERAKYIRTEEMGEPHGYAPLDVAGRVRGTDTYIEDYGVPWIRLGTVDFDAEASGDHNGKIIASKEINSPGFRYIPLCFGSFLMEGSGEVYLTNASDSVPISRAWHSYSSGRSGVLMVPANPSAMTGMLQARVRIRKIQGESGSYDRPVGVGAGTISIFAVPA